jgi:nicotinamidase/pyrazinamidase
MRRLFFDVDTQKDFILSDGALSVPGAEEIIPNLKKLTQFARTNEIQIMGSIDNHYGDDAHKEKEVELAKWGGQFPEHCMNGSEGQEKIPETTPLDPALIANRAYTLEELNARVKGKKEIYFEKQGYDVFDNPNVTELTKAFDEVVIYGVATDYCVLMAALGFQKQGKRVFVVRDAIKAVNAKPSDEERALSKMKVAGIEFVNTSDIAK